jgi:hypothetical protein
MSFPGFDTLLRSGEFDTGILKGVENVLARLSAGSIVDARHVAIFAKINTETAGNVLNALVKLAVLNKIECYKCGTCRTIQNASDIGDQQECQSCGIDHADFEIVIGYQPAGAALLEIANPRDSKKLVKQKPNKIIVVVIHGIRTYAEWVTTLEEELSDCPHVVVKEAGYGRFDVCQFLCPVYFRQAAVRVAKAKILEAQADFVGYDLVVVAHSFGTYVLTEAMRDGIIRPKRVILCGSVLKTNFPWAKLPHCPQVDVNTGKEAIVNDCGDLDWWPVLAKFSTIGFGVAGTAGFKSSRVKDRHHRLGHSDYLSNVAKPKSWQFYKKKVSKNYSEQPNLSGRDFMREFWRPFILTGEIVRPNYTKARLTLPFAMGVLEFMRVRNIVVVIALLSIISVVINFVFIDDRSDIQHMDIGEPITHRSVFNTYNETTMPEYAKKGLVAKQV